MMVGAKYRLSGRRTMPTFDTMSLPTDVQETLINEPAKRGPHLPQRGDVPAPGDRPGRGNE